MKKILLLSTICCLFGISCQAVWAATYYMPDNFVNLHVAFAGMQGGDTLIIRDGSYTGTENTIDRNHFPPHGTNDNWTIIKAEHDGKVYFGDPDSTDPTFYVEFQDDSYVQLEGLVWLGGCHVGAVSYIKFLRCGSGSNVVNVANATFSNNVSNHILYEDCYAWGGSRYKFLAYRSNNIIFRRCVGRIDACDTLHGGTKKEPIGGIAIYWSSDCEVQNCIIIDSDTIDYWNYESLVGAFSTPNMGGNNNSFRGCIDLHGDMPLHGQHSAYTNTHRINCIGWDSPSGSLLGGETYYDHLTMGNISTNYTHAAVDGHTDNGCHVVNSIFIDMSATYGAVENIVESDRNYFYNNVLNYNHATAGTHDVTNINPLRNSLLYLPRIEANSDLSGKASDGGDAGARVTKRIGVSGTLWGEPGYNTTTDEDLWPWPNEDIIKMNLRTYSHPQVSGTRGFCADGKQLNGIDDITLTSYIWEYLRNPIPPEIYGGQRPNEKPHASAGPDQELTDSDDNEQEQVILNASASYDPDGSIMSHVWSENGSQIATGVNPTITLDVGTHLLSLVVTDNNNAPSTDDVRVNIDPAERDQTSPVIISNVKTMNVASMSATISWDTDEPSTSKILYGLTSSYGQEVENVALVTNHEVIISGLKPSSTYHFQVISKDGNNNEANSAGYTFTTQSEGTTFNTFQNFEDSVVWIPGGGQDPTGNGRGWAFLDAGSNAKIEIGTIGANGSSHSLKVTFDSDNPQIYFRSNDKITDHMPEAKGANRMSFYVRFPEGFPIQTQPFRYDTWQLGTYIHDPNDWNDTHGATSESDHGIHHYYHRVTIEQVGNGWVKYIINTHPDQASYSGSTVPPNRPDYFDNFGRFYFHFGPQAGGPNPGRQFTIWIDEIKFYYDDRSIGGQVHDGGQDDAGFDGQFIPDSSSDTTAPDDVANFNATPGSGQIALSWTNPTNTDFAGVMIRYRTDGTNPQDKDDGWPIPNGNDGKIAGSPGQNMSYVHSNLDSEKHYYYSAFTYDTSNNYSHTAWADAQPLPSPGHDPVIESFTADPTTLNNPGETTTFNVSATNPDGDSLTYTINFGDGTANGSGSQVAHTYETEGTYTAEVTVDDGHGNTVGESIQITVDDVPPTKPTGVTAN